MTNFPYFKFYAMDWIGGDIQSVGMAEQGVFINLCARIWKSGGSIERDDELLSHILRVDKQMLSTCLDLLIKRDVLLSNGDGMLAVKFISEQLADRSELSEKRASAGSLGGKARPKRSVKQKPSNCLATSRERAGSELELESELDPEEDPPLKVPPAGDIDRNEPAKPKPKTYKTWTEAEFRAECNAANHDELLQPAEVDDFVAYWLEASTTGRTRLQMEKTWDTRRRMQTAVRMIFEHQRNGGTRRYVSDLL